MRTITCLLIGTIFLSLCGCGKRIVPVSGEVLYEGKPAKDVAVLFEPKSDAKFVAVSGIAVTDTDGRFSILSTEKKQKRGLESGTYTVYFGWKNPDEVEVSDAGPSPGDAPPRPVPYRFPKKINDGEVVVSVQNDGDNRFVFKIMPEDILWYTGAR